MKKLLYFIGVILITCSCGAPVQITDSNREINNFVYNNGSVTWSNVYHFNPEDFESVKIWFNQSFNITKETDKLMIGETNQNVLPIAESGLDRMSVVMLFTHPCVVYFNTEFKEDRYRVTVNRIIWYPNVGITTYGLHQKVSPMDLNEIAIDNGGYKSVFYKKSSYDLDTMLTYIFTPKLNSLSNDNW